jgi:predicted transcriptional regulator
MKRNDLDICADMLQIARVGARKTHLVYEANLNFKMAKRYLQKLMTRGFLVLEAGHYFTTEKGAEFLTRYDELHNAM